ncbi:MAG: NAD(P)H-dependent oxidoreductase [Candidatus Saccharimonadales bacterium]|nr:NAD(P)H-dependent oxidoreductase [Candidatus Saccharimonadales bacterium]
MSKLNIPVLLGTTREQRKSIHVAKYLVEVGKQRGDVETFLVDPKDFKFEGDGNDPEGKDPRYGEITAKADGFMIVVPEYNHSFPGSLKRMLDSELKNYIHKPVGMSGVSSGRFSGVRAMEHLTPVLRQLGLVVSFADIHVANSYDAFDDDGKMSKETAEHLPKAVEKGWDELVWLAQTLKHGRENLPNIHHE